MARPPKDPDEVLLPPIAFRLNAKDHAIWMEKIASSGMKKSEFIRAAVINNETVVHERKKTSGDKKRLLFVANKASNNINQLAHRANSDKVAGIISESTYLDILYELQAMNAYLKATVKNAD